MYLFSTGAMTYSTNAAQCFTRPLIIVRLTVVRCYWWKMTWPLVCLNDCLQWSQQSIFLYDQPGISEVGWYAKNENVNKGLFVVFVAQFAMQFNTWQVPKE